MSACRIAVALGVVLGATACTAVGNLAMKVMEKPTVTPVGNGVYEIYLEGSSFASRDAIWKQWDKAATDTCPKGYSILERNYVPTQGSTNPHLMGRIRCK